MHRIPASFVPALLLLICCASVSAEIPFEKPFKLPAERRLWRALNEPVLKNFDLTWQSLAPAKDARRPDDFWRHWPLPFSPFYAGIKLSADQFPLSALYRGGKLYYPHAWYEPFHDYDTFFDLHESLAWLYAFNSPANPFFRSRPLRLRAQQMALIHLIGMVQDAPNGNIIGGWNIQYGNCIAWNAHVLKLLDDTEPLPPDLKSAWLECLDYVIHTLDAQPASALQTPMGHWNLWPVCGAFYLWQASGDPRHEALLNKWAGLQLIPDAFNDGAHYLDGASPVGYIRYSGIDLGYNGQAKNWMAPLFAALGPDSLVGHFGRRQYQFASFVSLEEPDGTLSSIQHMNSHSPQSVPYEQWASHKHLAYAAVIPDAVPFAVRAGYAPRSTGGKEAFLAGQHHMEQMEVRTLPPIEFAVRSYPSNYLNLPAALTAYPDRLPADLNVRTRPMEHLAYAKWFRSPIVRDEFFVRRMPAYHLTLYSGPCRDEVSNAGGHLNGIGSGGLGQLWIDGAGTLLMAATDLAPNPSMTGDFEQVWTPLAINALMAQTMDGHVLCTGWTGSLMDVDPTGRQITIRGGVAEPVATSYSTPMTGALAWTRQISLSPAALRVSATLDVHAQLKSALEVIPVAFFKDTTLLARTEVGEVITSPWTGRKRLKELHVKRPHGAVLLILDKALELSWGQLKTSLSPAAGQNAESRALQVWLDPPLPAHGASITYELRIESDTPSAAAIPSIVHPNAALPDARVGQLYRVAFETRDAQPAYWGLTAGALPPGLTLNRNGFLTGSPSRPGQYRFDIQQTDPYTARPFGRKNSIAPAVNIVVAP